MLRSGAMDMEPDAPMSSPVESFEAMQEVGHAPRSHRTNHRAVAAALPPAPLPLTELSAGCHVWKAGQHPDGRAFGGELYGERNVQHTYRIINHADLFQRTGCFQ